VIGFGTQFPTCLSQSNPSRSQPDRSSTSGYSPVSHSQPEPHRINTPRFEPSTSQEPLSQPTPSTPVISQFFLSQPLLTTLLVHQNDLEKEIYEADVSLVDEYEEEEEEIPIEDLELVDPDPTHTKANPELVNPVDTRTEANQELAYPDHTQTKAVVEELLEEETHDPMTTTLYKETIGENLILESSPRFKNQRNLLRIRSL